MNKEKSLQRLTETENKIEEILELPIISKDSINNFDNAQRNLLGYKLTEKINSLTGIDREKFINKVESILVEDTKNQLWESNHIQITWAISVLINENKNFPHINEIAKKTNLSRTTIYKHLNEFKKHPIYQQQRDNIDLMADKITWRMYDLANNGDTKAARLFLEVAGKLVKVNAMQNIKNQNNYIQINGMTFNEEQLKALSPDKLKQIENILTTANLEQPLFEDCEITGIKGKI